MLKKAMLALMLAGLLYTVTSVAVAQENSSPDQQAAPAGPPPGHGQGRFDPAKRGEMLAKHLNLNADQQAKVTDILKSEQSQMESLRSDNSTAQQDRHAKMMEIHKSSNEQIRAVLNPDQQKKFDEMTSKRQQWMQQHQQGGGAPPSSESQPK
jgi:Spy/CpxP family protein refolding chaperone